MQWRTLGATASMPLTETRNRLLVHRKFFLLSALLLGPLPADPDERNPP
jgi:hypothetical protein